MCKEASRRAVRVGATTFLAALLVVSCFAAGCERPPEAEYDVASRKVGKAEQAVLKLQDALEASEAHAREALEGVERDRKALIDARQKLAKAEGRLGELATDEVLFRAIQRQLLDDEALRQSAISVKVEQGRVTLSGQVASSKLRARAAEKLAGARGVKGVDNRIEVSASAPKS